jgi:RNA polymerase sigma factor (sigma-70 family)
MAVDVPWSGRRTGAQRMPLRPMVLASDEHLVALTRAGDQEAFETLYRRHQRGVAAACRSLLGSAEDVQDVVQHTFSAAYRDLMGAGKLIDFKPWLHTIARNRCVDVLRGRREQPMEELPEAATNALSAEVLLREEVRELMGDLAALPDDQRQAVVLASLSACSSQEIAGILDCPPARVSALVFRARTSLTLTRTARDTPCEDIREQLATLTGGALRRGALGRHLRLCEGCRRFRASVRGSAA